MKQPAPRSRRRSRGPGGAPRARLVGAIALSTIATGCRSGPAAPADAPWRRLKEVEAAGERAPTGSFIVSDRSAQRWQRPPVVERPGVTTGRKGAKVVVLIYDPILESQGSRPLTELVSANDPIEYSHILVDVIREASWGYLNYDIVEVLRIDGFPIKVDGFRYDDDGFWTVRQTQQWQPATISYRALFEENSLLDRFRREGITELWLWGASGMHFDEFAFFVPNRPARFGPTDNPWLYRPYDIPPELGRTTWVMGFNYEVGPDNMIHSYVHRIESIAALQFGDGIWNPSAQRDPWNVFTRLEMEHPGTPSQVGNCHVPPNGQGGYDYDNPRSVLSGADHWHRYPDVRGAPRLHSSDGWGNNQFGYMRWLLSKIPKFPGATEHGYNNWWVYIGNTDEDLAEWPASDRSRFLAPEDLPAPVPPAR